MKKNDFSKLQVGDVVKRKPVCCWDFTEHWKLINKKNTLKKDWCVEFICLENGFHRWISKDNLWLIEELHI